MLAAQNPQALSLEKIPFYSGFIQVDVLDFRLFGVCSGWQRVRCSAFSLSYGSRGDSGFVYVLCLGLGLS
jgi:hypothetical protein